MPPAYINVTFVATNVALRLKAMLPKPELPGSNPIQARRTGQSETSIRTFMLCFDHLYCLSDCVLSVQDIMEDSIEEKLDQRHFPFLAGRAQSSGYQAPTTRYRSLFY